jgi:septal ring factor EnvC (AmiA/AmiB activator)
MVNAPETASKSSSSALIQQKNGDVRNRAGIANYTAHWDKNSAQDSPENTEARKEVYTEVVNGYYDVRSRSLPLFLRFDERAMEARGASAALLLPPLRSR